MLNWALINRNILYGLYITIFKRDYMSNIKNDLKLIKSFTND